MHIFLGFLIFCLSHLGQGAVPVHDAAVKANCCVGSFSLDEHGADDDKVFVITSLNEPPQIGDTVIRIEFGSGIQKEILCENSSMFCNVYAVKMFTNKRCALVVEFKHDNSAGFVDDVRIFDLVTDNYDTCYAAERLNTSANVYFQELPLKKINLPALGVHDYQPYAQTYVNPFGDGKLEFVKSEAYPCMGIRLWFLAENTDAPAPRIYYPVVFYYSDQHWVTVEEPENAETEK